MYELINRHLPKNKEKWKMYLRTFIPLILGATLFALNGVVDNFMVGHITQGQTSLGIINTWTNIPTSWFLGISTAGSVLMGQFFFAKKYDIVKQIQRYRFYLCIIPSILLTTLFLINPNILIRPLYHGHDVNVLDNAKKYGKLITVQWLLIAISFNLANQLREVGYGKVPMFWSIGTITINVLFNSIFMYVFKMGVEVAAWASIYSRLFAITVGIFAFIKLSDKIGFAPWSIFKVSWYIRKMFWKRFIYVFSVFSIGVFVQIRIIFYDIGYPVDSLGVGVGGISVISLTGALLSVFITTFSALTSMSSNFVASELGKKNFEQAKINSDEIKGFVTIASLFMSLLLVAFALPHITFFSSDKYISNKLIFNGRAQLTQVSYALIVLAFFCPPWIWFSASYRNGSSGGKGVAFSIIDWFGSLFQVAWMAIIIFGIIPKWEYAKENFWITFMLFYLSNFIKMGFTEWKYYKYEWLYSLT